MMTKKQKEFANYLVETLVKAMKETTATPVSANKGRKSATPNEEPKPKKPTKAKYSTDIKDYEPKKNGKFYNWASYKAQRTKYCYAYATSGRAVGCFENGERYCTFEQIADEYAEAKKKFEKKYKYVKKADQ
jgi:hypothetical protein